jgi:hypothetical protein
MVEKDGEALKVLWIALRRLYRKALAPKPQAKSHPNQVRLAYRLAVNQKDTNMMNMMKLGHWAFPAPIDDVMTTTASFATIATLNNNEAIGNATLASQALPSPYIFGCLIRTLIWLAPDQRYGRKEHRILWQAFSEDLILSWKLIHHSHDPNSNECFVGDISTILIELLTHYFSRVQSSLLYIEEDTSIQVGQVFYRCKLHHGEFLYLQTLSTLTQLTVNFALSPILIDLTSSIWSFLYIMAKHVSSTESVTTGMISNSPTWSAGKVITSQWISELITSLRILEKKAIDQHE